MTDDKGSEQEARTVTLDEILAAEYRRGKAEAEKRIYQDLLDTDLVITPEHNTTLRKVIFGDRDVD